MFLLSVALFVFLLQSNTQPAFGSSTDGPTAAYDIQAPPSQNAENGILFKAASRGLASAPSPGEPLYGGRTQSGVKYGGTLGAEHSLGSVACGLHYSACVRGMAESVPKLATSTVRKSITHSAEEDGPNIEETLKDDESGMRGDYFLKEISAYQPSSRSMPGQGIHQRTRLSAAHSAPENGKMQADLLSMPTAQERSFLRSLDNPEGGHHRNLFIEKAPTVLLLSNLWNEHIMRPTALGGTGVRTEADREATAYISDLVSTFWKDLYGLSPRTTSESTRFS
ncbi:hypothetical protein TGP89_231860 [Toxoplasma gondii p89]|uniref:Uncharacterized protein n=1 Tax=Toxoplasma gondii p89 TaxID=943119 RepID=A0A086L352_TOXGO|nr:hypothetical protein TGP89_231860 [Toxoplasma gondii p89]